jgi:hypothetical protein
MTTKSLDTTKSLNDGFLGVVIVAFLLGMVAGVVIAAASAVAGG